MVVRPQHVRVFDACRDEGVSSESRKASESGEEEDGVRDSRLLGRDDRVAERPR